MAGRFPPRIFRRVSFEAEIRIRFEDGGEEMVARTANISLGGMFVIASQPRPVGTSFDLEFKLPEQPAPVRGRGRVVWIREEETDGLPPGMGVRFLELTPGSRELIFQVVERRVRDGGSPYDDGVASESIADRRDEEDDGGESPGEVAPAEVYTTPAPPSGDATAAGGAPLQEEPAVSLLVPGETPASPPEEPPALAPPAEPSLPPLGSDEAAAGFDATDPGEAPREVLRVPDLDSPLPAAPPPPAEETPERVRLVEMPDPEPFYPEVETARDETPGVGSAAYARTKSRRGGLWLVLAAVLFLAAGAWYWLNRDRSASVEVAEVSVPATAPGRDGAESGDAATGEDGAEPDANGGEAAPARSPADSAGAVDANGERSPSGEPAGSADEPAPSDASAPQARSTPAGPAAAAASGTDAGATAVRSVSRITWQGRGGGTDLVIWGDGGFSDDSYRSYRLDGASPRQVVRLLGISEPLSPAVLDVGTPQIRRVRSGLHLETDPDELHIVIDLAGPGVGEATLRPDGNRLLVRFEGR